MSTVKEEAAEALREMARQYWRRSDNVPLGRDGQGVERVGELRDVARLIEELAEVVELVKAPTDSAAKTYLRVYKTLPGIRAEVARILAAALWAGRQSGGAR